MHAVSTSYSAEIRPDARLRRLVLLTGALLFLLGLAFLPLLAVSGPLKERESVLLVPARGPI